MHFSCACSLETVAIPWAQRPPALHACVWPLLVCWSSSCIPCEPFLSIYIFVFTERWRACEVDKDTESWEKKREWLLACRIGEETLGKLFVCQMGQGTKAYMGEFLKQYLVLIALMDYQESFYVCSLLVYHFSVDLSGLLSGSLVSSSSKIYRPFTRSLTFRYTSMDTYRHRPQTHTYSVFMCVWVCLYFSPCELLAFFFSLYPLHSLSFLIALPFLLSRFSSIPYMYPT